MIIRWRAVDPGEADCGQGSSEWTRVHASNDGRHDSDARTLCGLKIPDMPYIEDMDGDVPAGAPRCKTCLRIDRRAVITPDDRLLAGAER